MSNQGQLSKQKCYCKFGYCDATEKTPCFCDCHRDGKEGCWNIDCNFRELET